MEQTNDDHRVLRKSISNSSMEDFRGMSQNSSTEFRPRSDSMESDSSLEYHLSRGSSQSSLGRDRSGSISLLRSSMESDDEEDKITIKVEVEDYLILKSSRVVTVVLSRSETVRQAMARIAKKNQIAMDVETAVLNYVLWIPNFDGTSRGIIMSMNRLLSSYGLKNRDGLVLKKKSTSLLDLQGPPSPNPSLVRTPSMKMLNPTPLAEQEKAGSSSTSNLLGRFRTKSVTGPNLQRIASGATRGNDNEQRQQKKVFGADLEAAVSSGNSFGIPSIVHKSIEWLEGNALDVEGLFQKTGSERELLLFRKAFETGEEVDFSKNANPFTVAELLKLFLESLPEPLMSFQLYDIMLTAYNDASDKGSTDNTDFFSMAKFFIQKLPVRNKLVLARLLQFFNKLLQRSDKNKLSAEFFPRTFGSIFLRPHPRITILQDENQRNQETVKAVIAIIIKQYRDIFVTLLQREPSLIAGEKTHFKIDKVATYLSIVEDVDRLSEQPYECMGILWITNYRIHWIQSLAENNNEEDPFEFSIPFGTIYSVKKLKKTKLYAAGLLLTCKDCRSVVLTFREKDSAVKKAKEFLLDHIYPKSLSDTFAFAYSQKGEGKDGWKLLDMGAEYGRMGISTHFAKWRHSLVNNEFNVTSHYPRDLIVPHKLSDDALLKSAKARSGGCFPVVTWANSRMRSFMLQAGAPEKQADAEPKLWEAFQDAGQTSEKILVIDTGSEPPQNWHSTTFKTCKFEYLGLASSSILRENFAMLEKIVKPNRVQMDSLSKPWLDQIRKVLAGCERIVNLMETGHLVLIQEGSGCQMAHLVSSVAQLCLDSYYRTLNGFCVLIEKQWLHFGFPFLQRMGHCTPPPKKTSADQTSPIWFLFIDIVWQLWRQFPIAFQFNEELLTFLLEHSHSNLYGTFLFNNDKERLAKQVSVQTVSVWTAVLASPQRFTNPFHINDSRTLKPSLDLTLWKSYYFHWNQAITFFQKKIRGTFTKTLFSETQELNLEKKGLVSLPAELTKCTTLVSINLNRNDFNTIPVELLHLTNLKDLNLSNNQIRGQSHDFFALFVERLNLLEHFTLRGNCMEQLPNVIGELNKLKTLDLSDNRFWHLPFTIAHINTLQKLVLNTNRIAQFPDLTDLTGLTYLDLSANSIAALESNIALKNLKVLKLAKNNLKSLPEKFDFPNLEELDLSANRIASIPPTFFSSLKKTLRKLKIRANGLTALPPGFKELQLLADLNLEANSLKEFSPDLLELSNLQRLNLNKNKISQIPTEIAKLKDLLELSLSNNQLTALPPSIGQIEKIETLDVSDNLLDALPPTIALLTKLSDFRFDRNKLRLMPKSIVGGGPTIVFGYLKDLLKGSQRIYRSRVMVVGQENVGKTSLCNCLRKRFNNNKENITTLSTDGITIDTWTIQSTVDSEEGKVKQDIYLSMWDFAGQEIYYATHQFFMSKRCVYILVWNLATDPDKSKIEFWLHSIKARAKSVSVFIIGTHLDHPKLNNEVATYILKRLEKKYKAMFPTLELHFRAVSCSTGDGVKRLRFELEEIVLRQKHMGESVPTSFLLLEKQLAEEAANRIPPVISKPTLQQFASVVNIVDERELSRASKTLHELGSIIHFDSDPKLSDMVVLSPRWLTEMLATVFTTKHNFARNGILPHSSLLQIWKPPSYPNKLHKSLLQLLEAFEIAFSLSPFDPEKYNGSSLIPSLLPVDPSEEFSRIWSTSDRSQVPKNGYRDLKRIYKFDFIPFGLFGRLIVRLLKFTNPAIYWRNGIVIHNEEKKETVFIELSPEKNMIEITNRSTEAAANTPRDILETLETLIRHWYRVSIQVFVPCVHCLDERIQNPTLFPLDLCQTWAVSADKQYVNCNKNDIITAVRLDRLVPDLTMKDFSGSKIAWEELAVGDVIGEGGAATVYTGVWNNQQVAIKKLRVQMEENRFSGLEEEDESFTKVFNEFRREVYIMSGLEHPNLVQLKGLCLDPLCIVTEFMSSGDLYGTIHNKEVTFDWPLRLKIAMDIASGMSFLHSAKPPIIHRDLKSPNVLLSSLSVKARVVAKVADFGLSGTIQTVATMEVANPRWLAPEIMLKGEFTTASDVYSFGVVLWELLTRQDFFSDTSFNSEIEKRVLEGKRPEIPSSCPANYAQLITECWSQQPNNRPPFKEIKSRLQEIKRELCVEFPSLHSVLSASTTDLAALLENANIKPSDLISSPESSKENSISDYSTGHLTPPQVMSSSHRTSSADLLVQEVSNNNNNFEDDIDEDDIEREDESNSESENLRSESSISLTASGPQEALDSDEDV